MNNPRITKITITKIQIEKTEEIIDAYNEVFKVKNPSLISPLNRYDLSFEIHGAPVSYANAYRRVLNDEMEVKCLYIPNKLRSAKQTPDQIDLEDGFDVEETTEQLMTEQHITIQIESIKLRPFLPDSVTDNLCFELDVHNPTPACRVIYSKDLRVLRGNLKSAIMNGTIPLAILQPGKKLKIRKITIRKNKGYIDGKYRLGIATRIKPLTEEYDRPNVKSTELSIDKRHMAAMSGFKHSSTTTLFYDYLVEAQFASCLDEKDVIICLQEATQSILSRMKYIKKFIINNEISTLDIFLTTVLDKYYKIELKLYNETSTVIYLLSHTIYANTSHEKLKLLTPNYNSITKEVSLVVLIDDKAPTEFMVKNVQIVIDTFEKFLDTIKKLK